MTETKKSKSCFSAKEMKEWDALRLNAVFKLENENLSGDRRAELEMLAANSQHLLELNKEKRRAAGLS